MPGDTPFFKPPRPSLGEVIAEVKRRYDITTTEFPGEGRPTCGSRWLATCHYSGGALRHTVLSDAVTHSAGGETEAAAVKALLKQLKKPEADRL